jgi:2-(1,2-epoxy-1,2-dihydrophenyl)acetyl-CoA isomerase
MQRAAALTFFGDKLPADEAVAMGLIYKAVPDEAFETAVTKLASRLAAMPTRGIGLTKKAFNLGWQNDLSAHLTVERDLQMEASQTQDYAEGVAAFLEKRKPTFTGS